jgi:Tfp pilus assembly protein PilN
MDAAKWDRRAVARRLAVLGRQAGFPVADLTAALRRADEPAYFVYDGHWTAAGHRAAARAVRQRLRELRWLQECGG